MKILFDYSIFMMQEYGGISRVMNELIRQSMKDTNIDCEVWAGIHVNHTLNELSKEFPGRIHGNRIQNIWMKKKIFSPINQFGFQKFGRRFMPDICHYTYFNVPVIKHSVKRIMTVHDLIYEMYPSKDKQVKLRRKNLPIADGIVCVSENTRKDLLRWYSLNPDRVIVAHHGNSMADVVPKPTHVGAPFFLYVGKRNVWYKNFYLMLDAFIESKLINEYKLVCFGGEKPGNEEKRYFREKGLEDKVILTCGNDTILAGLYQTAKALIYPSKYEGFGLPLVEAMGCGCPIVTSSIAVTHEVASESAIYFDAESKLELIHSMVQVTEEETRKKLIETGKKRALEFTWEKSYQRIRNFYECMLN